MQSVSRFIEKKLRLRVNREKSAVGRPWQRKYLGFCLTNSRKNPKIRIHWKTIKRFKQRVREISLEALEKPQNPCEGTPEKGCVPNICPDDRLCP